MSHPPIDGVGAGLNDVLAANFLGTHKIPLRNISIAGRVVTSSGVVDITSSVRGTKGFLDQHAPLVVVDASLVPAGELGAEAAANLPVRILDGAHRVHVLKQLYPSDKCFLCRIYVEFDPTEEPIIAASEHETAQRFAPHATRGRPVETPASTIVQRSPSASSSNPWCNDLIQPARFWYLPLPLYPLSGGQH